MTEPIINGVDVSECEITRYSDDKQDKHSILCDLSALDNPYYCIDNPNCYYKQLKRKEQECEELKNKLEKAENNGIKIFNLFSELGEKYKKLKREHERNPRF